MNLANDAAEPWSRIQRYYRLASVRQRVTEYCGGRNASLPESWSAPGIAGFGGRRMLREVDGGPVAVPRRDFARLLEDGADIHRSLADWCGATIELDVDYADPADPARPYREPENVFRDLEPVYDAIRAEFARVGVEPLVLMTARGYHFVIRALRQTRFYRSLVEIGSIDESLRARYEAYGGEDAVEMGRAHEGAGRIVEFLSHRVIEKIYGRSRVPLTLADVPPPDGGAFICLDLSAYGDPLFERYIRCAFSSNQKASMAGIAPERPFSICLPRNRTSLKTLMAAREDPEKASILASGLSTRIPDVAEDDHRWIADYAESRLAEIHLEFDLGHPSGRAGQAGDLLHDFEFLPPCAEHPLRSPNPSLLRPVFLRTVTMTLLDLGWHPRSIAGLIRTKFEQDHHWEGMWSRYNAETRAGFYVRLFFGAASCGIENRADFTCESQEGRGVCQGPACGHELAQTFKFFGGPAKDCELRGRFS